MRPQHSLDCVKQRDRHRYFLFNISFMLNKFNNLPTAAVISDRQATGGSDMATSPAYQRPVDSDSSKFTFTKVLAEPVSNARAGQGAWPFPRGGQAVPPVGTASSPEGNRPCEASEQPSVMPSALPVHVLCHDPYAWFSQRGQRLHSLSIGILPSPRSNGVRYTGEFNIEGFIYTVGAASVDGLFIEAMQKRCRHLRGIHVRQQRKRARCAARYRERYPCAGLPKWLAPSEN